MPSGYLKFESKNDTDFISNFPGYEVNLTGQVRNKYTQEILNVEIIDSIPCVYVRWKNIRFVRCQKQGYIPVADMVAANFKPTSLPLHILTQCQALPIDGNEFNLHPSNLVWKFPKDGIEVSYLEGFYYIPGYTQYAITHKGVVIHLSTLSVKQQYEQMGAFVVSAHRDGTQTLPAVTVYRLLALTFLDYPLNAEKMVVNHRDGIRMNISLDNLEWLSQQENVWHARMRKLLGYTPPRFTYVASELDRVKTKDLLDTLVLGSTELDCEKSNKKVEAKEARCIPLNMKKHSTSLIKRLDINTREIVIFNSRACALEESGIIDNQLYQSLVAAGKDGGLGIVKSKYIFRYENEDFPEITEDVLKNHLKFGGGPRVVVVKDNANGSITEHESAAAFVRSSNLSKKVVTSRLSRSEQFIPLTTLQAQYKDSLTDWAV